MGGHQIQQSLFCLEFRRYTKGCHLFLWPCWSDRCLHPAALRLRLDHRIIGVLVGCLPTDKAEQNLFAGLPLVLSVEEVALGCHRGFIKLVDGDANYPPVPKEAVENHQKLRKESLEIAQNAVGLIDQPPFIPINPLVGI